jgi:preprotein translocase subunit SecD
MLQFSRIQATLILVTVLAICGFAVPNFVSDQTIRGWPDWAQRHITLAPELQGGTSALLEVNRNAVLEQVLASLRREVRSILRNAHINLARPVTVRSASIEVRPLKDNFEVALTELRKLSQEFNGVRPVKVTDIGGELIRLTPTDAGVREYEPPIVARSIADIRARLSHLPTTFERTRATVDREGANRLKVQVPTLGPAEISRRIPAH